MLSIKDKWERQQSEELDKAIKWAGDTSTLGKVLGVTTAVVVNWKARGRISATMAEKLEEITEGRFKKRDLRPDVIKWWSEK